jgi:hypothetical protein
MRPYRLLSVALAAVCAVAGSVAARAQGADESSRWRFQAGLYGWLPTFDARLNYALPNGVPGTASVKADANNYLDELNAAVMVSAEARYDRFSIVTDFIYVGLGSSSSRVRSANPSPLPGNPVASTQTLSADSNLDTTLWTLAAGVTLARGAWGNVDVIGGFRYLGIDAHTDYRLAADINGPGGRGVVLGRNGRLSGSDTIWNGIAGIRGRLLIGDSGVFVPYYIDLGTGDSRLTWQTFAGVGYQSGWAGVQLGYRYLSFDQSNRGLVDSLSMGGPYLAVNFSF